MQPAMLAPPGQSEPVPEVNGTAVAPSLHGPGTLALVTNVAVAPGGIAQAEACGVGVNEEPSGLKSSTAKSTFTTSLLVQVMTISALTLFAQPVALPSVFTSVTAKKKW